MLSNQRLQIYQCICPAAFRRLQGFNERREKLFAHYEGKKHPFFYGEMFFKAATAWTRSSRIFDAVLNASTGWSLLNEDCLHFKHHLVISVHLPKMFSLCLLAKSAHRQWSDFFTETSIFTLPHVNEVSHTDEQSSLIQLNWKLLILVVRKGPLISPLINLLILYCSSWNNEFTFAI